MKYFFASILVTFFILAPVPLAGQMEQAVRLFDEGNIRLLDGIFVDALSSYEGAESTGWASVELFYNMGLVHHRLDNLGQSIRYLEKAKLLDPEDRKVLHALNVARNRQADRFSQLPVPFWKKLHIFSMRTIPVPVAFWLGTLAWIILVALLTAKLLLGYDSEWWRRARLVAGILAGVFILYAFSSSAWPPYKQQAVILLEEVRMREQADGNAEEILALHEGLLVTIRTRAADWSLVQIPNGTRGWIPSSTMADI